MRLLPLLLATLFTASACQGPTQPPPPVIPHDPVDAGTRGPDAGTPDAGVPDAGPPPGRLQVTLTGYPLGMVRLQGPNGFTRELTRNQMLTELEPGTYTVIAEPAYDPGFHVRSVYLPSVTGSPATVPSGGQATLEVKYSRRAGSGAMWAVDSSTTSLYGVDDENFSRLDGWEPIQDHQLVELSSPSGSGVDQLAFDATGSLWLTRIHSDSIVRYAPDQLAVTGTQDPVAVLTGLRSPRGVAFDTEGNLWTASGDTVLRLPAATLSAPGTRQAEPDLILSGGMLTASAPTFDATGALYVVSTLDSSLVKFERSQLSGSGERSVQPTAVFTSADLDTPMALAFDAAGNLYVSNSPTGPNTGFITRFSHASLQATGTVQLTRSMRLDSDELTGPRGLAFDDGGNLWVATSGSGTLAYFTAGQVAGTGTFKLRAIATIERFQHSTDHITGVAFNPPPAALPLAR
jgi:DNA-binding beta-propeller fold protein YncE